MPHWNQSLDMAPKKAAAPDFTFARLLPSARALLADCAFGWATVAGVAAVDAVVWALERFGFGLVDCTREMVTISETCCRKHHNGMQSTHDKQNKHARKHTHTLLTLDTFQCVQSTANA